MRLTAKCVYVQIQLLKVVFMLVCVLMKLLLFTGFCMYFSLKPKLMLKCKVTSTLSLAIR